tara:strand:+ start:183139 stop:183288 length:150 start_codon:yes stop_codon:yes gene_type:complete
MSREDDRFFPCNEREAEILRTLKGDDLERYKELRHGGATVTEALEAVQK